MANSKSLPASVNRTCFVTPGAGQHAKVITQPTTQHILHYQYYKLGDMFQ